jgi:hypothetical protein
MPMPKKKRERLHQIHRWLQDQFPAPYKTELKVVQIGPSGRPPSPQGDCARVGRKMLIRVDRRLPWAVAIDTLIHEYAHGYVWEAPSIEDTREHHGSEWGVAYAKIYQAFYDNEGWQESREF